MSIDPGAIAAEKEAATAAILAQVQQAKLQNEVATAAADRRSMGDAASSAAAGATVNPTTGQSYSGAAGNRLQSRLNRQEFIEKKRAEGLSDTEIRGLITTLPPEQTGGAAPIAPTATPAPTEAPGSTQDMTTTPTTPDAPTPSKTTPKGQDQAPAPSPRAGAFAALIAGTQDPQLKAVLMAMQAEDELTGALAPGQEMSQEEFAASGDAQAIGKPFDAIQDILNKADKRLQTGEAAMKSFLKGQFDRNDRWNAAQQENINNQLTFTNQKATRDQVDANKKDLDSRTIKLALMGGFGSDDGNNEIAEARMKGEQAIIDLNKEFGFKKTDVALQFTQMHNEAFDNYQQRWLQATDDFETRISNLDMQGISNQSAKAAAINSAYGDYKTEIKDARKEHAKKITDATSLVYDYMKTEKDNQRTDSKNAMDTLLTLRGQGVQNISGTMLQALQDKLPGIDVNGILNDPTDASLKAAHDAADEYSATAADFTDPSDASIMDGATLASYGMGGTAEERAAFKNEVARKLKAGDREGAKNYMYTQIANQLKGAALTEFDARSNQIIQIDDIVQQMEATPDFNYSTQEYYKQKALALVGKASPEYYSLMAPLAQLSAEITHGLSGAAVSPSEWDRLQKFMPRTGEGKAVLSVKLKTLKRVASWINEAKLARAANLPIPQDPTLTPSEQKSQLDTPKEDYIPNNDSMHDALAPANGHPLSYISNFRVTQDYGSTWDQEHGYMSGPHYALDLAPKVKGELTTVPALRGGKVISVNKLPGLGNSVLIEDADGNRFEYGHFDSLYVHEGDVVDDDAALGIMGSTGQSTGVHLHLGVKDKSGKPVDPRNYLT